MQIISHHYGCYRKMAVNAQSKENKRKHFKLTTVSLYFCQVCDEEKDEPKVCMTSDAFREFRHFQKHLKSIPEAGGG